MSSLLENPNLQGKTPFELLFIVWQYLSLRRKFQLFMLLILMLLSSIAELVSIGAVIPFLSVLSNPDSIWSNRFVFRLANNFGFDTASEIILPITLIFIFTCILASIIRLLSIWAIGKCSALIGSDLSVLSYRKTLYQPYIIHIKRNSSEIINTITMQTARTTGGITAFLQMSSSLIIAVSLFFGFFVVSWKIATLAIVVFSISYLLIAQYTSKRLRHNSSIISSNSQSLIKTLQESLGSIRDLLLDSKQNLYVNMFSITDREQKLRLAKNQFLASFPRYSLEPLGIVFIACLGYWMLRGGNDPSVVLPLLGTIALGSQKLLPALQQVYNAWAKLRGFQSDIIGVISLLQQAYSDYVKDVQPLKIFKDISFQDVCFSYSEGGRLVNKSINTKIQSHDLVGVIGETGSGKSTFIDLLMGLLEPSEGKILINGQNLHDPLNNSFLESWRASISHVPQNIFLTDSSFTSNIAFGVPKSEINLDRVYFAAKQACIYDFIASTSHGFDTIVGEKGINMSGGQRQRIGIARAIYKNSPIVVLDEATSALDINTERAVMNNLITNFSNSTFIVIAHRIATLNSCNRIIKLSNGYLTED